MALTKLQANPMQNSFILGDITFLVGLQFKKGYNIRNALNFFEQALIPLHLKYKDGYFLPKNGPATIYTIQKFDSIREASDFVDINIRPHFDKELGLIAHNDNQLILHLNHASCDGIFVKYLLNNFQNSKILENVPQFNEDDFVVFKNEIQKAPKMPSFFSNPSILRTFQRLKPVAKKERVSHEITIIPASKFKLYDPIKNSPKKFTESMWLSVYFATCLNQNKFLKSAAIPTVCETRKWLPHPPDLSNGNNDSVIIPSIQKIDEFMTIEEVGKILRSDMNDRFARKEQFSYLKELITPPSENSEKPLPGNIWSTSSIGPLTIKNPIVDLWMNTSGKAAGAGSLCLLTYSICQPEKRRNDVVVNLQYDEGVWNRKEAKRMNDIFEYFFTNVSPKMTVKNVYSEMRKYFKPF